MGDAQGLLTELGFGEYEARAYLALLGRESLNGYELAKLSGVPRANIYGVLQKLEDRGAVVHMDTAAGSRYAALPVSELLTNLERRYQATLAATADELSQITAPAEDGHAWNIEGYEHLLEHARALLGQAEGRILVATWPQEARVLAADLNGAQERGVEITTLCLAGCQQECGACRGSIHRYRLSDDEAERTLVVVTDHPSTTAETESDGDVLAAEIFPGGPDALVVYAARGIRTRQRQLVDLTASYIRHSVALAAVLADLGPHLAKLLHPETRRALAQLFAPGPHAEWLAGLLDRPAANPAGDDPAST